MEGGVVEERMEGSRGGSGDYMPTIILGEPGSLVWGWGAGARVNIVFVLHTYCSSGKVVLLIVVERHLKSAVHTLRKKHKHFILDFLNNMYN